MCSETTRRQFLKTTAAFGACYWVGNSVAPAESKSALETINFACIGVGGKGRGDTNDARVRGNLIALCDIDEENLNRAADRSPKAKTYFDYRKMLDEMGKSIDAITISTPDHSHAPAAVRAMRQGIHCFCQSPLSHSVTEARLMAQIAREKKLKTQMGNQGTASIGLREAAALVQSGAIGRVREVHVWTNRPVWPQGIDRPQDRPPIPKHIHWDLWLGPAKPRPYNPAYIPFKWRAWWDFGNGTLGDTACHTLNMPFMALNLRDPVTIQAKTSGHNNESFPAWSIIDFEFPKRGQHDAVKLTWYDGNQRPPQQLLPGKKLSYSGALLVGDRGTLYSLGDYGTTFGILFGDQDVSARDLKVDVEVTRSPGHFQEWVNAIKGGPEARSNFPDYSGPLTETVLLGNLAVWADGKKIEWDAKTQTAPNAPEVAHLIRRKYRAGYEVFE